MIVCICHRVSDRDIAQAAREGCASFDELQFELGVATSCGKCHDCARKTFHQQAERLSSDAALPEASHASLLAGLHTAVAGRYATPHDAVA